jgi:hypothetical protein
MNYGEMIALKMRLRTWKDEFRRHPGVESEVWGVIEQLDRCRAQTPSLFSESDLKYIDIDKKSVATTTPYWGRIRGTLSRFCNGDDQLFCMGSFHESGKTCEMCAHRPISDNNVLLNPRTKSQLLVGNECINNYKLVMEEMGHQVKPIIFRSKSEADRMNRLYPGIATYGSADVDVESEDETDDLEALHEMGLDPADPDFADLAPHGMTADGHDDGWPADDEGDEEPQDYRNSGGAGDER